MSRGVRLEVAAEDQVGFYERTGEVFIKEKAQNTLHKYKLQFKENIYQEIWSEDFPDGVNTASVISMYDDDMYEDGYNLKLVLHDKSTSSTLLLSSDGKELLDSWHHDDEILLTCFSSAFYGLFVFAMEMAEGEYKIVIVEGSSTIRLQPVAAKPTWSNPYLSVCEIMRRLAVISTDHTLDIYDDRETGE